MKQFILFTYLTFNVIMSSLLNVTACGTKIDDINKFLKEHKSGEFKDYADLIKEANNINAQNLEGLGALHQGMCWMLFIS
jgi:hypothetical protein